MSITQETRREAYKRVDMTKMEAKVYGAIAEFGAMSAEQIMEKLGIPTPTLYGPGSQGWRRRGLSRQPGSG